MVWILNEKKKTKASGASITTHFSGLPKMGTYSAGLVPTT